jgi:DNA-binding NarL/FixJ family response regulator
MNVKPTRVLLVDDHALVRAGIRALIGMTDGVAEVVGEAGNGFEAMRLIESLSPDAVLLDLAMPGVPGLEVLQQIRERFPEVRVIVLTMHEAREYAIQALRGGAAGFIPKSAAASEIKQAIQAVMEGKTYISAMTPQDSAGAVGGEATPDRLLGNLTPRQREILTLIAEGKSTKQIAALLDISVKTVETHRAQLTERLNIHDVAGLVRFAIRAGLIKVGFAVCLALAFAVLAAGHILFVD